MTEKYSNSKKQMIDQSFKIGLISKMLVAVGEAIAGLLLCFFKSSTLQYAILILTSGQLEKNPHHFLASHLIQLGNMITIESQKAAAFYLLSHGAVKLFALILLWRKQLWAYPLSILIFIAFIIYQFRLFISNGNWALIFISLVDVVMIILTWIEYQSMSAKRKSSGL
ncbi:DUF2127 domain-containing protein [Streptococcus ictaluri]|nr:DUF2127 domain-containing protein [Streptococcus ictaluri]